jgi:hypothetical protein
MSTNIIIICILAFLLWYYFIKSKEYEIKSIELYNENVKIKKKNNFLQEYKNDISKTFKILNNELIVINDKVKNNPELNTNLLGQGIVNSLFNNINSQTQTTTIPNPPPNPPPNLPPIPSTNTSTNTSPPIQQNILPPISQTLLSLFNQNTPNQNVQELQNTRETRNLQPISSVFNNIFNRFLTDDLNSSSVLPNSHMYFSIDTIPLTPLRQQQNTQSHEENTQENTQENIQQESVERILQQNLETIKEESESEL